MLQLRISRHRLNCQAAFGQPARYAASVQALLFRAEPVKIPLSFRISPVVNDDWRGAKKRRPPRGERTARNYRGAAWTARRPPSISPSERLTEGEADRARLSNVVAKAGTPAALPVEGQLRRFVEDVVNIKNGV